jgi:mRNA-degrading endonuclease RelE of RelBE toxin-antitoxin system
MSWAVEVKPTAEKQYRKLDKKARARVLEALRDLEQAENPFLHPGMRALTGELKGDWRLRAGELRILIEPQKETKTLQVYAILPRGGAY